MKIFQDEQQSILKELNNFTHTYLNKPNDWIYISSIVKKEGNDHVQISSRTGFLGEDDLYLRFGKYNDKNEVKKQIIVARISFLNQRKGYGTKLLMTLCKIAEKYDYRSISIEQPNANCLEFMKKRGFQENRVIPITVLKESIKFYGKK